MQHVRSNAASSSMESLCAPFLGKKRGAQALVRNGGVSQAPANEAGPPEQKNLSTSEVPSTGNAERQPWTLEVPVPVPAACVTEKGPLATSVPSAQAPSSPAAAGPGAVLSPPPGLTTGHEDFRGARAGRLAPAGHCSRISQPRQEFLDLSYHPNADTGDGVLPQAVVVLLRALQTSICSLSRRHGDLHGRTVDERVLREGYEALVYLLQDSLCGADKQAEMRARRVLNRVATVLNEYHLGKRKRCSEGKSGRELLIIAFDQDGEGKAFQFDSFGQGFTVGRPGFCNDIPIAAEQMEITSRVQVLVQADTAEEQWIVTDLGSKNGLAISWRRFASGPWSEDGSSYSNQGTRRSLLVSWREEALVDFHNGCLLLFHPGSCTRCSRGMPICRGPCGHPSWCRVCADSAAAAFTPCPLCG